MTTTKKTKRHKVDMNVLTELMQNLPQIPEGTSGNFSVTHKIEPAGTPIPIISMRNALMMGQRAANLVLDHPHTIQYLKENGSVWMSDTPQEVYQMRDVIKQAKGRVLIGGLGLGIIHHLLYMLNEQVETIDTIEKQLNVINLVAPHVAEGGLSEIPTAIHCGDLFEILKNAKNDFTFDFAFFDIWAGTGEMTWVEYVVPLRRLCRKKIPQPKILCWNEDEMKGQLRDALRRAAYIDGKTISYYEPLRIFAQNVMVTTPKIKLEQLRNMKTPQELDAYWNVGADNKGLHFLIERYLQPGTDTWERDFGQLWDQHVTNKQR